MGIHHLAAIEEGLAAYLATTVFTTPMPIQYPGRAFTLPTNGCYIRMAFEPNGSFYDPISDDDDAGAVGLLSLRIRWRADDGEIKAMRIAGELGQRFRRGTRIPGALPVRIDREPTVAGSITEAGGGILVPVTVYWTYSGD